MCISYDVHGGIWEVGGGGGESQLSLIIICPSKQVQHVVGIVFSLLYFHMRTKRVFVKHYGSWNTLYARKRCLNVVMVLY